VPRLLVFFLGLLAALVLSVVVLILLASTTGPSDARDATIVGLRAPTTVALDTEGVGLIEAASESDLFAGLGYVHALHNAWPMTLRRQVAAGRLSQWFPDSASLALDRHTLQLGFASAARTVYSALPDSARLLLDAYATGVNAAFDVNRLHRVDDFVMLDVEPEPWEPWHALAVEQLVAYLGTPVLEAASHGYQPSLELQHFLASDSLLRAYLQIGGLENSVAFVAADTLGTTVVHRIVHGHSALPLVQEVELRLPGRRVMATTIPGSLMLVGGFSEDGAWAVLPSGPATITAEVDEPPQSSYARVVRRDGAEALVEAYRAPGALFIGQAEPVTRVLRPPPADTLAIEGADPTQPLASPAQPAVSPVQPGVLDETDMVATIPQQGWWVLRWHGFGTGTDLLGWLDLLAGRTPTLNLFRHGMLLVGADGGTQVIGQPEFSQNVPGGVLIGGSPRARYVADRLAVADTLRPAMDALGADTYSTFAARVAPPLIGALGDPDTLAFELRDAVGFLTGWNHRYDAEAIGASIFETWLSAFRRTAGVVPDPEALQLAPVEQTDTLVLRFGDLVAREVAAARREGRRPSPVVVELEANPERADSLVALMRTRIVDPPDLALVKRALQQAVTELRERHGPPGAAWRWDRVQAAHVTFPVWGERGRSRTGAGRFRPVPLAQGGHPTAIVWGPSPLFPGAEPTASWIGWTTADRSIVHVYARNPYHEWPIDRYADRPETAPVRSLPLGRTLERVIQLMPAG
jgi:penicillin G amidase